MYFQRSVLGFLFFIAINTCGGSTWRIAMYIIFLIVSIILIKDESI